MICLRDPSLRIRARFDDGSTKWITLRELGRNSGPASAVGGTGSTMNVRGELAAAMAALNLTPTAAAPIERLLDSLASKPDAADYWAARGKSRYVTELTEDGLPLEVIDSVAR